MATRSTTGAKPQVIEPLAKREAWKALQRTMKKCANYISEGYSRKTPSAASG